MADILYLSKFTKRWTYFQHCLMYKFGICIHALHVNPNALPPQALTTQAVGKNKVNVN